MQPRSSYQHADPSHSDAPHEYEHQRPYDRRSRLPEYQQKRDIAVCGAGLQTYTVACVVFDDIQSFVCQSLLFSRIHITGTRSLTKKFQIYLYVIHMTVSLDHGKEELVHGSKALTYVGTVLK